MINISLVEKDSEFSDYHMIIADFLVLLMERIDKEPYLLDLFSSYSKQNKASSKGSSGVNEESGSIFLPLKIALFLLKQTNPVDRSGLLVKVLQIIRLCSRVYDETLEQLVFKLDAIFV